MTLSLWRDRPCAQKLLALAAVAVLGLLAGAGVSWRAFGEVESRTAEMTQLTGLSRANLEGDMAHDAMRADVLQALAFPTGPQHAESLAALREHSDVLQGRLAQVADAHLSAELDASTDAASEAVDRYTALGLQVAELAARDHEAAVAAYPGFSRAFTEVEDLLPVVSDAVDARAEAAAAQVRAAQGSARWQLVLTGLLAALFVAAVAVAVLRAVVGPVRQVARALQAMSEGDLRVKADVAARDELGAMADALGLAQAGVGDLVGSLGRSAAVLAEESRTLTAASRQMGGSARETTSQASSAAAGADQVSRSVQGMAAGTEQMGASIREIARSASEAASVAQEAVRLAEQANSTVAELGEAGTQIEAVLGVIATIADQTNLLALNATIEAAHAGEAGKGFAVVAHEVKELSQETARATGDIARRVEAMRASTGSAVAAIAEVVNVIARIEDHQTTIAGAVEEQAATTAEMSRSASEVASGSTGIASGIGRVADAALSTSSGVEETSRAAEALAATSSDLLALAGRFRS